VVYCTFCGQATEVEFLCPNDHAICDECQLADWPQVVERVCTGTHETDPSVIANLIMKHPMSVMHSPQHHILVTATPLAALRNSGEVELRSGKLAAAIERTQGIPLGSCGLRGECGAAVGVGALVSIITGATFQKDRERSLTLQANAEALLEIARAGGPRCCKQSVYLSLETASEFLKRELSIICRSSPLRIASRYESCRRNGVSIMLLESAVAVRWNP